MKKKLFSLVVAAAVMALVIGCSDEEDPIGTGNGDEESPDRVVSVIAQRTGDEVTGVTWNVKTDDMAYIYVDPLSVGFTYVKFDEVEVYLNGTRYRLIDDYNPNAQDPDGQGPIWYYVARFQNTWRDLNNVNRYGTWDWRFQPAGGNETIYFSIYDWTGITVSAGNSGGKYEIGVAFKAPADGELVIPDFGVISHDDDDINTEPPGTVNIVIERFRD